MDDYIKKYMSFVTGQESDGWINKEMQDYTTQGNATTYPLS